MSWVVGQAGRLPPDERQTPNVPAISGLRLRKWTAIVSMQFADKEQLMAVG